jgi:hypothetical protein
MRLRYSPPEVVTEDSPVSRKRVGLRSRLGALPEREEIDLSYCVVDAGERVAFANVVGVGELRVRMVR